ncbi:hypothetical protein HII31_12383 [Pseudocercospora fuligena]|uniref:Peptidase A1 domain-containing protein n=1 Tax=Pseudocercospora fuligena TaxID=685502 RepID=A0A8H6R873_9PEZI|nr:hypothetical protein HII31_12383 [Pseudocercospora fuligena]
MAPTRQRHIHWQTPLLLLSSLLIGTCLAIGHHAFYQSLDATPVDSNRFDLAGWTTSQQQLVSVAGVLFAFVVKASLILCASIAYIQLFFRAIQTRDFRLKTLDQWFAALGDIRSLFGIAAIYRYPVMTLIATTTWLLPLASVFSPAALSVAFDLIQPSPISSVRVPQPPFESVAMSSFELKPGVWETNIPVTMSGPSEETARIVNAVASGGSILPIQPPSSNASWQLSFEAPRLSCYDIEGDLYRQVRQNIFNAFNASRQNFPFAPNAFYGPTINSGMFSYLSWMDDYRLGTTTKQTLPFQYNVEGDEEWHLSDQTRLSNIYVHGSNLSIGVFPNANIIPTGNWSEILLTQNTTDTPYIWRDWEKAANLMMDWYLLDATLLRCELSNANYTLNFTYINQEQHISIVSVTELPTIKQVFNNLSFNTSTKGTLAITGTTIDDEAVGSTPDEIARNSQRSLSYTALWQATLNVILGASNEPYDMLGGATFQNDTYRTQVFSTKLMDTVEMNKLHKGVLNAQELTNKTSGQVYDIADSLLPLPGTQSQARQPLKEALEELFFNITVSIMSSDTLQYNSSNPYAPGPVNVTFAHYGNIYVYEPSKLWIPYGIAIGLSILNAICGFWAIFDTGASFTADFSTLARLIKNAEIATEMREDVAPGKDPLPRRIGEAKFKLCTNEMRKDEPPRYTETRMRSLVT